MLETKGLDLGMDIGGIQEGVLTWEKLREEKRMRTREKNTLMVVNNLETKPFCQYQFEKVSGNYCNLGDYGNLVNEINDFELNTVFRALGIVDSDGGNLETETLRRMVVGKKDQERRMVFRDEEGRVELSIDFFSERSDINFGTWVRGLDENVREKVVNKFEGMEVVGIKKELITSLVESDNKWIPLPTNGEEKEYLLKILERYTRESWKGLRLEKDETEKMVKWVRDEEVFEGSDDSRQFLETKTARDILWALDICHLVPGRHFISAISEGFCGDERAFNSRYGNGFAELTRLLTTYVGKDTGDWIFEDGSFELDKIDFLRKTKNTEGMDEGASMVLDLLSQVILKDSGGENSFEYYRSGLGLHGSGACEDSEYYLVSEISESKVSGDDNFVYFYGHGRLNKGDYDVFGEYMMAMSRKEMVVNGIEIPSGYLCRVSEDKAKVEPLRASMFCFDEEVSKEIFGKQYDKFIYNGGNFGVGRSLLLP